MTVEHSALDRAVDLVDRFGEAGGLPGAAVDLLRAATRPPPGGKLSQVDGEAVTRAFVDRTGYPREIIDPSVQLDPERVLEKLWQRVVGQEEATLLLRNLVVTLKTGLCDPSRPLSSWRRPGRRRRRSSSSWSTTRGRSPPSLSLRERGKGRGEGEHQRMKLTS